MEFKWNEVWLNVGLNQNELDDLENGIICVDLNGGNCLSFDAATSLRVSDGQDKPRAVLRGSNLDIVLSSQELPIEIGRQAITGDEELKFGLKGGITIYGNLNPKKA